MFPEVQDDFAESSDHKRSAWLQHELPNHIKTTNGGACTDAERQKAVDDTASSFTATLMAAAEATIPTAVLPRRNPNPSKYPRKPKYWNDNIQQLDILAKAAARDYVFVLTYSLYIALGTPVSWRRYALTLPAPIQLSMRSLKQ
jgi:hypothetical protein